MSIKPGEEEVYHASEHEAAQIPRETEFLNRAVNDRPDYPALECTVKEVEEVKVVVKILPIFISTIMLNCCLAQLSTFPPWQHLSLSSVLVSTVNHITSTFGHTPCLYGINLNDYQLDRFYWLMGILSGLNFLHYPFLG
ncbi:hypothetical protein AgCh_017366 [Apium graveolens]